MKIRIMGTEHECQEFAKMCRQMIPKKNLRSISNFYPNRRGAYSNEGRIYIDVDVAENEQLGVIKLDVIQ